MKYSEMLDKGLSETELKEHLVDGDMTAVTIRIPSNLKIAAQEAATLKGISFSAFARICMIDELAKRS